MSTPALPAMAARPARGISVASLAGFAYKNTTRLWWCLTLAGQLLFVVAMISFYGGAALRGDMLAWNRFMQHGHDQGDGFGNGLVVLHLLTAAFVIVAGALQLSQKLRSKLPRLHRWSGRVYILSAYLISLSGLYMMWVRGTIGGFANHVGMSILAFIIMVCATKAVLAAMAGEIPKHRQWALRLYIAMSTSLFLRAGLHLGFLVPAGLQEYFSTFMSYAQFVIPLAMLEMYLRTRANAGAPRRLMFATAMLVLSISMGTGLMVATQSIWIPEIKLALANRMDRVAQLEAIVKKQGVEAAKVQYQAFRADPVIARELVEADLNRLGYRLIAFERLEDALSILRLNVSMYPASGNVYDSLAEACMLAGDKAQAIANYQQALRIKPQNENARAMLKKLQAGT